MAQGTTARAQRMPGPIQHELPAAMIFDGDDTLWSAQEAYEQAKYKFYTLMESLGFDRHQSADRLQRIDVSNVATMGFSRERFPRSIRETYHALAHDSRTAVVPIIEEEARAIGESVFTYTPHLVPDVDSILSRLHQVYRLYLYTAGDRAIQQAKINELHVQRYFDAVWLTDRKSTSDLQCHLHAHAIDPAISWSVGNSPRSDINVGVGVGLRCIWVQNSSWEFEQEPVLPGAVWKAATLDDVLSIVMRIDHVSV